MSLHCGLGSGLFGCGAECRCTRAVTLLEINACVVVLIADIGEIESGAKTILGCVGC